MPTTTEVCAIDVFYGPGAVGNRHHLIYRARPAWRDLPAPYANIPNLILLHSAKESLHAQFFNRGKPVQRCGSGNLAIATYVSNYLAAGIGTWQLNTPAEALQLGVDNQSAFYLNQPLRQQVLRHPQLWQQLIGQPLVDGCYCGGRGDYVLLEVSQPLAQLRLNSAKLCRLSRRAVIVLYRPATGPVQLRYFAPQYGPTEDAATGSASVQAAAYLKQRYAHEYSHQQFEVQQRSSGGGCIYVTNQVRQVVVRGRTAVASHLELQSAAAIG